MTSEKKNVEMKEIVMQQSVSLFHNNIVVWRELVDTLLNGVPSDDPFLLIFFHFLTFCCSFHCFVINGRDVLNKWQQQDVCVYNFASGENFCGKTFCGNYFLRKLFFGRELFSADHENKKKTKIAKITTQNI